MERELDKFAKTEPFNSSNDVEELGDKAGSNPATNEELDLKEQLDKRDRERSELEIPHESKLSE
jgi:hypothetical protein